MNSNVEIDRVKQRKIAKNKINTKYEYICRNYIHSKLYKMSNLLM